jgi:hypothetical protein
MLGGLYIKGQNDQRITSFVCRSPVDEGTALDQCGEGFGIQGLEFGCIVNLEGHQALTIAVVTHAIVPRVHIPAVITRKIKRLSEEVMELVPICEALSIYAVLDHRSLAAQQYVWPEVIL